MESTASLLDSFQQLFLQQINLEDPSSLDVQLAANEQLIGQIFIGI
jgi:hypothetical protein